MRPRHEEAIEHHADRLVRLDENSSGLAAARPRTSATARWNARTHSLRSGRSTASGATSASTHRPPRDRNRRAERERRGLEPRDPTASHASRNCATLALGQHVRPRHPRVRGLRRSTNPGADGRRAGGARAIDPVAVRTRRTPRSWRVPPASSAITGSQPPTARVGSARVRGSAAGTPRSKNTTDSDRQDCASRTRDGDAFGAPVLRRDAVRTAIARGGALRRPSASSTSIRVSGSRHPRSDDRDPRDGARDRRRRRARVRRRAARLDERAQESATAPFARVNPATRTGPPGSASESRSRCAAIMKRSARRTASLECLSNGAARASSAAMRARRRRRIDSIAGSSEKRSSPSTAAPRRRRAVRTDLRGDRASHEAGSLRETPHDDGQGAIAGELGGRAHVVRARLPIVSTDTPRSGPRGRGRRARGAGTRGWGRSGSGLASRRARRASAGGLDHVAPRARHRPRSGEEYETARTRGSGRESELELPVRHPPAYPPGALTASLPGLASPASAGFSTRRATAPSVRRREARVGRDHLRVASAKPANPLPRWSRDRRTRSAC